MTDRTSSAAAIFDRTGVDRRRTRSSGRDPAAVSPVRGHSSVLRLVGDDISTLCPPVVVETWFLFCDNGRWMSTAEVREAMASGDHPHRYAAAAADRAGVAGDVVHSTSWRMEAGSIVLTYIVISSRPLPGEAYSVHDEHDHLGGTPPDHAGDPETADATLAPDGLGSSAVLHHAIHHLALLARTNPSIISSLSRSALESLDRLAPAGAGVLPFRSFV